MTISATDLFSAKPKITKMEIANMDNHIYVKEFTMADRQKIQNYAKECEHSFLGYTIIFGVCDENGTRLFEESEYDKVNEMPENTFAALFAAVIEGNKVDEKEVAKN